MTGPSPITTTSRSAATSAALTTSAGATPRQLARAGRRAAFGVGARGFVVENLQQALGIAVDGIFGPATAARVRQLQSARRLQVSGRAGAEEFRAAGIAWPTEFEGCMNLVSCFEGTSFGDCNSTDIDGAGLTMGVAGFTSGHGEVQMLLAQYLAAQPDALEPLLPRPEHEMLLRDLASRTPHAAWRPLFYNADGKVKPCWKRAFTVLGQQAYMRQIQMHMAESRFWVPAVIAAEKLGFRSLQAQCFFLDVAVQNGGWRKEHLDCARHDLDWKSGHEPARLAAAAKAVAACAKSRWRDDVLSRKLTIATGEGRVHGRHYRLEAYAIS